MKKVIIPILIGIVIISLGAIIYDQYQKKEKTESTKFYTELSFAELKTKLDNEDSFAMVIHQDGCGHCETYLPIFKGVADDNELNVYGLNQTNLSEDEYTEFAELFTISGTPTTVFIDKGVEVTTTNRLVGSVNRSKLITKLQSLGYIEA